MPHVRNQNLVAKFSSSPGGSDERLAKRKIVNKSGEQANPANNHIKSVASLTLVDGDSIFMTTVTTRSPCPDYHISVEIEEQAAKCSW